MAFGNLHTVRTVLIISQVDIRGSVHISAIPKSYLEKNWILDLDRIR